MKKRQLQILQLIIENEPVSSETIMKIHNISKRTFYYDIENINYYIKNLGQLRNGEYGYRFIGDRNSMKLHSRDFNALINLNQKERQQHILYKLLLEKELTFEHLVQVLSVSKNTVISDLEEIKKQLLEDDIHLNYDTYYSISGNEWKIRDHFLKLLQFDNNIFNIREKAVLEIDQTYDLELTDYSMSFLSQCIRFIRLRLELGNYLEFFDYEEDTHLFDTLSKILGTENKVELSYLSAYIKSLQSLNSKTIDDLISPYVDLLIQEFETLSATTIHDKPYFKANLMQHLQSSYYRIKYRFPAINPQLSHIKSKYNDLFYILTCIVEAEPNGIFSKMREEEIAYITIYFGGYLRSQNSTTGIKNRIILVCPHGLMISKQLEIQIIKAIPNIKIVGRLTLSQLDSFEGEYDYIISTIPLKDHDNVLLVNALLNDRDMNMILDAIHRHGDTKDSSKVALLLEAVSKYGTINDEEKLKSLFTSILYTDMKRKEKEPMLKELLVKETMQRIKKVNSWQEAIELASKPLLDNGSVEPEYVAAMIESIETNGPYIVLADYFALPHASSATGVNTLSMALLSLEEPVDLKGKPVKLFIVLAPIDNTTHMVALASLTEIMMDESLLKIFIDGNLDAILELVNKEGGEA